MPEGIVISMDDLMRALFGQAQSEGSPEFRAAHRRRRNLVSPEERSRLQESSLEAGAAWDERHGYPMKSREKQTLEAMRRSKKRTYGKRMEKRLGYREAQGE